MKKITTQKVAQLMGLDVQTVRVLAQMGRLPFCEVIPRPKTKMYLFNPAKLAEWCGVTVKELEGML